MKGKIFNAQEVQSILNGSKVMFREVIKPYPILSDDKSYWEFKGVRWAGENSSYAKNFGDNARPVMPDLCPYQVGQKIFVKERFARSFDNEGNPIAILEADSKQEGKWKPAQHMKREHSRLTLEITDIKVERLGEISKEDAIKEGATSRPNCSGYANRYDGWSMDWSKVGEASKWASNRKTLSESDVCMGSAQYAFINSWIANHKKLEEKFEVNPFVWVVDFKINK